MMRRWMKIRTNRLDSYLKTTNAVGYIEKMSFFHDYRREQKCQKICMPVLYKNVRKWIGPNPRMAEIFLELKCLGNSRQRNSPFSQIF